MNLLDMKAQFFVVNQQVSASYFLLRTEQRKLNAAIITHPEFIATVELSYVRFGCKNLSAVKIKTDS